MGKCENEGVKFFKYAKAQRYYEMILYLVFEILFMFSPSCQPPLLIDTHNLQ